jgi:hypothetical protein
MVWSWVQLAVPHPLQPPFVPEQSAQLMSVYCPVIIGLVQEPLTGYGG